MEMKIFDTPIFVEFESPEAFHELLKDPDSLASEVIRRVLHDFMLDLSFRDKKSKLTPEQIADYTKHLNTDHMELAECYQILTAHMQTPRFNKKHRNSIDKFMRYAIVPLLGVGAIYNAEGHMQVKLMKDYAKKIHA